MNTKVGVAFLVGGWIVAGILLCRGESFTRYASAQDAPRYPVSASNAPVSPPGGLQQLPPMPTIPGPVSVDSLSAPCPQSCTVPLVTQQAEGILQSPAASNARIWKFKTTVAPTYEGGAIGQELPVTVEVRITGLKDFTPAQLRQHLPEKIKIGLTQALSGSTADKFEQILERLERIEKRLQEVESQKTPPLLPTSVNVNSGY